MVPHNTSAAEGPQLAHPNADSFVDLPGHELKRTQREVDWPQPFEREHSSQAEPTIEHRTSSDTSVGIGWCTMRALRAGPSRVGKLGGIGKAGTGAGAAAAPGPSPWRPLVLRAVIGAAALLGLSSIGAGSILLGLDGAHASPPSTVGAAPTASIQPTPAGSHSGPNATSVKANAAASADAQASTAECAAITDDGRVILNLAGADALRRIPGIGSKRAEAILQLRARLKRFKRTSDLLRVRGIGPKSLARMQSHFVLDAPIGTVCANARAPH